ncbi:probable phospholipid hydroperoxide glutathione peroxidase [Lolium rigidum]|uniref:probable phospholipid hydroperoxide glutathione peroxidase n=1 Tax=Lolium rigidum TaxID=89674 RepID=UPI001F5CE3E0|nr:probable phospholipid hydroperoxide glutathione peroxidase [Lolium rigidum]XP_051193430.1 probable phospholipid hydroperoxide glutathione peroxidase [Lolium perenne]
MPSRPAPFISRLRLLRTAVASPASSALLPHSHPRLAIPAAAPPLPRAFAAASSPLVRPGAARFAHFSMAAAASSASSVHDFTVKDASGKDVDLSTYKGKVLLIVNVASQCGLTNSNYTELSQLYEKYKDQGFEILAFPCNQFGGQEPGTNEEIVQFACTRFKAEYPIFDKVDVNGDNVAPIYKFLKTSKGSLFGDNIKWNFSKFLVDKEGRVVDRYAPTTSPLSIEKDLKKLLASS